MAANAKLLRNITTSGGLFTENILLKLRDRPESQEIGKLDQFVTKDEIQALKKSGKIKEEKVSSLEKQEKREYLKKQRQKLYEWGERKWEEIFPKIKLGEISKNDIQQKWLIPLFEGLGYSLEKCVSNKEDIDEDSFLKDFEISLQSINPDNLLFFHFVDPNENLDEKIEKNPKTLSHHDVCQQFVNFNSRIKWLVLSNGTNLRLITKYFYSYSKGYLDFNLKDIFGGDVKEFNLLYSLLHHSRFYQIDSEKLFLIEKFQKASQEEGVKIGDNLRDNVHNAIELLGNELIQQNPLLFRRVKNDEIDLQEYYAELLRIIYRNIFILYAEQREMLPGSGTLYFQNFSLSSFRILAEKPIKNDNNCDLWKKLFLTYQLVKDGDDFLGVQCFNGSLFDNDNLKIIYNVREPLKLSNDVVLQIIRLLTTSKMNNLRQRINFIEVSEEEIGAIYESLLDFFPVFTKKDIFKLQYQTTERKGTGSYYTPKSLIDILIRTTLKPLIKKRLEDAGENKEEQEQAMLDLKICDPACGGGTILLSALDYSGEILARIRSEYINPDESEMRHARRDILQHCIYGVDKNPLAVELAKISLWLRACVKEKPLNFLDNHIKNGDSLIGLGKKPKKLIIEANNFQALTGNKSTGIEPENKVLQNKIRVQIREEVSSIKKTSMKIGRITEFLDQEKSLEFDSKDYQKIIDMAENNIEQIEKKQQCYEQLHQKKEFKKLEILADAWTASFFWPIANSNLMDFSYPNNTFLAEISSGKVKSKKIEKTQNIITEITHDNKFFHWYLEFPEVFGGKRKGFDLILSNPPWETLQLKEMEFFVGIDEIENAPNQSKRRDQIAQLSKTKPTTYNKYKKAFQNLKKFSKYLSNSQIFDLTAKGTINTYMVFAERCYNLISSRGYAGIVCPTGIVMNYYMQDFFRTLVQKNSIISMFDFENAKKIFDIHRSFRFCLLSLSGGEISQKIIPMTFYTHNPVEVQEPLSIFLENRQNLKKRLKNLPDDHILIPLEQSDFELFNPNTLTCLSFRQKKDVEILRKIYKNCPILIKKDLDTGEILSNPWEISFKSLFHMSNDSEYFITERELKETYGETLKKETYYYTSGTERFYPLYEGRMIWHYNHRLSSMEFAGEGKKRKSISRFSTEKELKKPNFYITPNYWVNEKEIEKKFGKKKLKKWFISFRDVTGTTNERTFISTITPYSAAGHTLPILLSDISPKSQSILYANLTTLILDYISRIKVSGLHMSYFIIEQLPIFSLERYNVPLKQKIISKVIELTYTSHDLDGFAHDVEFIGDPFVWDPNRRAKLKSDLDAIFAHLYDIARVELEYIMETFDNLKRKNLDEFNEYRTKRFILEAYDKYAQQPELFK